MYLLPSQHCFGFYKKKIEEMRHLPKERKRKKKGKDSKEIELIEKSVEMR